MINGHSKAKTAGSATQITQNNVQSRAKVSHWYHQVFQGSFHLKRLGVPLDLT